MNDIDIKYMGIPNICFSLTDSDDEREEVYSKQRQERGFDNSELWCLDNTIGRFILPRLEAFRDIEINGGYPGCFKNNKQWVKVLNQMVRAWQLSIKDGTLTDEENKEHDKGMKLFYKYFYCLWC